MGVTEGTVRPNEERMTPGGWGEGGREKSGHIGVCCQVDKRGKRPGEGDGPRG